jgi:endo-alpha-1,4-polygalactosaminidase (GH114 family)
LGESVYTDYNFDKKKYSKVDADTNAQQLKWLNEAKQENPKLKIYTLDYAEPADTNTIRDIYKTERSNGFIPYVATVGLDKLVEEPKR